MKRIISELGKDKKGILWSVEVEDDKFAGFHFVRFLPFFGGKKPSLRRSNETEIAQLKVESEKTAKLDEIKIGKKYENKRLGSLLIKFIEKWAIGQGIEELYGDLAKKDSGHFDKLKHFYENNGWTFKLFNESQPKELNSTTIVGRVSKKII